MRRTTLTLMAVALLSTACGEITNETVAGTSTEVPATTAAPDDTVPPEDTDVPTTIGSDDTSSSTELAKSTVQIVQLLGEGENYEFGCYAGSGSIISADGFIVTNFHVIENEGGQCDYDNIGVSVIDQTDQAPEVRYYADVYAADPFLDLAVLKIRETVGGDTVGDDFVPIPVGDSDQIELGDEIRVFGYPAIGGSTITFTQGTVSGFGGEPGLDGRAWIKTDATFSGGNSGGAAIGPDGSLIGVPTEAGSGIEGDPTDCRVIQDTNGDGTINDLDSCIPIGGFINGVRPINLAAPLIAEAEVGEPIGIPSYDDFFGDPGNAVTTDIAFSNVVFGTGIDPTTDTLVDVVTRIDTGASDEICLSWDYEGMADGLIFDVLWYANDDLVEEASVIEQVWNLGATGNAWSCLINFDGPVADGLYEVTVLVEGELFASSQLFAGDEFPAQLFTLVNASDGPVCFVFLSPAQATYWGSDQLGSTEIIDAGTDRVWELASAVYDFRARDCDGEVLVETQIDVTSDAEYTFTG